MRVIVDTPVWSELLRRREPNPQVTVRLRELIFNGEAILLGPIRQEILNGVKESSQFAKLRKALRAFPEQAITVEDYENAAAFNNLCRRSGIQGSNTDFLICSVATRLDAQIWTLDRDFLEFAKVLPIKLFGTGFI